VSARNILTKHFKVKCTCRWSCS